MRLPKIKIAISFILVFAILFSSIAGYFVFIYQSPSKIYDETENTQTNENIVDNISTDETDTEAVLSENVKIFPFGDVIEINSYVENVYYTDEGTYLELAPGSDFESLGIGDIFFMEGSNISASETSYIGKITAVSKQDDTTTYLIETPMFDEVFDVLKFETSQLLSEDNIVSIETAPGVEVTQTNDIRVYFADDYQDDTAKNTPHALNNLENVQLDAMLLKDEFNTGYVCNVNIDLFKVFGLEKPSPKTTQKTYDATEAARITVYRTTTGACYHLDSCICTSRSKFEMTLLDAASEGFDACFLCNPPLIGDDDVQDLDCELMLKGKFGFENIDVEIDFEWDILEGKGLETFSTAVKGDVIAELGLDASLKYELGGKTTTISTGMDDLKLEGLAEKMFPLVFISYNGALNPPVFNSNRQIRALTGPVPLTIAIIIYADINGNISVSGNIEFDYKNSFVFEANIIENGEPKFQFDGNCDQDIYYGIKEEIKADVDAHIGCSVSLYIFNLNIAEIAVVKFGGQAEGTAKMDFSNKSIQNPDNAFDASFYTRLYLKLFEFHLKVKASGKLLSWLNLQGLIEYDAIFQDITLYEFGTKNSTKYVEGKMNYSTITASDEKAIYYKDTQGNLIREENGFRDEIYSNGFFTICGIDESYIYVLKTQGSHTYNVVRIDKKSGIEKTILNDVINILSWDQVYIYYISSFDKNTIYRMDRSTLKESCFVDKINSEILFMEKQDDNFYVGAKNSNIFAALFGDSSEYYLIDKNGNIVTSYGASPSVENYVLISFSNYHRAVKLISTGFLRSTAAEVYWLSKDKQTKILTNCISGWNPLNVGIFTTQENTSPNSDLPYKIVLYQAQSGEMMDVTEVNSDQAFFTLCQSSNNEWYFFDQTDTELILYTMKEDFSKKRVVKTFDLSEFNCDLRECGTIIMGNKIYFYTITNNSDAKVLYRYNIVY